MSHSGGKWNGGGGEGGVDLMALPFTFTFALSEYSTAGSPGNLIRVG